MAKYTTPELYTTDGRVIGCANAVAVVSLAGVPFVMVVGCGVDNLFFVQEWIPASIFKGANFDGWIDAVVLELARINAVGIVTTAIKNGQQPL